MADHRYFQQEAPFYNHTNTRYFGKDLTNLETQHFPIRESSQPAKSGLHSSSRDLKGINKAKPTPLQFYKNIMKNQRLLHKRSQTNEANRSGSVELREVISRSKGNIEVKDSQLASRGEVVKQQLGKFLKVKNKTECYQQPEANIENQIVIQEFKCDRDAENNSFLKPLKDAQSENFSGKFLSIPTLVPVALQKHRLSNVSKQTPTNAVQQLKLQASNVSKPHPINPEKTSKNFQNLRLQLDEGRKSSPKKIQSGPLSDRTSQGKQEIQNKLDVLQPQIHLSTLRRQFDIPFMWDYLLLQEVNHP